MNSRFNLTRSFLALTLAAAACGAALNQASAADAPPKPQPTEAKPPAAATKAIVGAPAAAQTNILIFRNVRSWKRTPDFEEALTELGFKFDVKHSADMATTDLTRYRCVIIPGAQSKDDYYVQYMDNAPQFERFVTNGGTLLLELNGAENAGIPLPRGVTMASHGAKDNAILLTNHPIVDPLAGRVIHASYASHGYLEGVPKDALILVTEMAEGKALMDKPTFVEYPHGNGRVIAACQCFHDRDGSGRGILMETAISYAADRQWYVPKK